jgi:NADPH-dependent 2,4-dienoyl-CoA reductase/sulfur reductase-like enzyme
LQLRPTNNDASGYLERNAEGNWTMTVPMETKCCIAGGGPAGMMLGVLLARAGIPVVVLEKHADFLEDFRGDTVHPSTLEVMHELGVLDEFLARTALGAAPGARHDRR